VKLVSNWRALIARAWSLKLLALAIILGALEIALPYLHGALPLQPGTFFALIFFINVLAAIARLMAQKGL
jgi:hypothetical protein